MLATASWLATRFLSLLPPATHSCFHLLLLISPPSTPRSLPSLSSRISYQIAWSFKRPPPGGWEISLPCLHLSPSALRWDRPYGQTQLRPRSQRQHAAEPCVVPQCVQCVYARQERQEGNKGGGREEGKLLRSCSGSVKARFSLW